MEANELLWLNELKASNREQVDAFWLTLQVPVTVTKGTWYHSGFGLASPA